MGLEKKTSTSGEIFAAFTMSKIDKDVLASMTPEQLEAVRQALIGSDSSKRHSVDIRGSFSLYFASFYFVFMAGRDRRLKTLLRQQQRDRTANKAFGAFGMLSLLGFIALIIAALAYYLKSEMGINIYPGQHLEDVLKSWLQ